ncbi:MAG: transposase [Planctomycetota bacterium]|nr:MAG: transposase [Planctomycetota bacterium]
MGARWAGELSNHSLHHVERHNKCAYLGCGFCDSKKLQSTGHPPEITVEPDSNPLNRLTCALLFLCSLTPFLAKGIAATARKTQPLLTDTQGSIIEPLMPRPQPSLKGGRKCVDNRRVLEGILWVWRTGARWQDLPEKYPSPSTCWR